MRYPNLLCASAAFFLCTQSIAGTFEADVSQTSWNWVGSFSLGPIWESAGETQTLDLTPYITKTYAAAVKTNPLIDGEVFVGIQKTLSKTFEEQIGVAWVIANHAKLSGNIWDDANPDFNNYTYKYAIQHNHIAVKGKLLFDQKHDVIPWISGSLGIGFNDAYSFQNTPLISEAVAMPNFTPHTQTSFVYTLGFGVQKVLSQHFQIGAGYEFSDWGKSQLGRAAGQTLSSGLSLNHLYTNGILFNLTYLS